MAERDVDEIQVAGNGDFYWAPEGTTPPASINDPFSNAWRKVGFLDENGATFTDGRSLIDIKVWQGFYPVRRITDAKTAEMATVMRQFGPDQLLAAHGGGTISEDAPGEYRFVPPDPSQVTVRSFALEWFDGDKHSIIVMQRGIVTSDAAIKFTRTAPADLNLTASLLGVDGADPWYLLTNDPAFATALSA